MQSSTMIKRCLAAIILCTCCSVSASAQTVATPTFSLNAGTWVGAQVVGIFDTTAGATICYTLDGSTPTATTPGTCLNGTPYVSAPLMSVSTTVKAIGTKVANTNSAMATVIYTITACQSMDGPACLPTLFATTFPNTTGYTVKTVCASGCDYTDPAAAVTAESCKTVLRIRANQSFQTAVVFTKVCTAGNWFVILSDDCTSAGVCTNLPAQGTRIAATPGAAPLTHMAKLTGANTSNALTISVGVGASASHFWVGPGIEITGPADGTTQTLSVTSDDTNGAAIDNIVYDRDYIHCAAAQNCTRGGFFGGAYEALVDSISNDMHSTVNTQSQGWISIGAVGPIKIVNNYLGGSSEPFFVGGDGCPIANNIPSDFEIAGNYLTYSFGSRSSTFLDVSHVGNIRSPLELKEGRRVLEQGNVLDASPVAGLAVGDLNFGILVRGINQNGPCTGLTTQDVTVRFNKSLHSTEGIAMQGGDSGGLDVAGFFNINYHDNLFDDQSRQNGTGTQEISIAGLAALKVPTYNIQVNHNTVISSDPASGNNTFQQECSTNGYMAGTQVYTNNMIFNLQFGPETILDNGSNVYGIPGFNQCMPGGYTITGNAVIGGSSGQWPGGNFFPANAAAVNFSNFNSGNGGNYLLTGGSAYHNAATDGKDIGVTDFTCLNSMVAAAIAGTYTELTALCVNPQPVISTISLPSGTVSVSYNQTVAATSGTPPYIFTVSVGSLPSGLSMNTSGNITGNPLSASTSSFTVLVTDANNQTATQPLSITVISVTATPSVTTNPGVTLQGGATIR